MVDLILIAIVIFGFINSYTDFRFGKIKNVLIILMILSGVSLNFYLNSLTLETLGNSLISLALGFILFYSDYWSPGDAKLFFAVSLLLPVSIYHFGKVSFFPSISILINSFVPITFFFFFQSLKNLQPKKLIKVIKDHFKPKEFTSSILLLFGFPFMFSFFNISLGTLTTTFIALIIFRMLKKFSDKYSLLLFLTLSMLHLIFGFKNILKFDFFFNFLVSILIYQAFNILLGFISSTSFSYRTHITNLRPGQIVGQDLYEAKGSFTTKFFKGATKITKLSKEQISKLRKLHASKKLKFETIRVEKTIPFAPIISFGALLTYLFQGNFFSFLYLLYLKPYFAILLS